MTWPFQNAAAVHVQNQNSVTGLSESEILAKQAEIDEKKSNTYRNHALTRDIEAQTELKIALSLFIAIAMVAVFYFQWSYTDKYLTNLIGLKQEIPKEVIIAILAASSSVVTLMGFILKGLFGVKHEEPKESKGS